ncbi:unnamed protein product [Thlaspi arvense]|uniref:Small auxin up regulated protein n=1 Tax=Thlaspi arvense TaxID=13288 RepID=A0AAU9RFX1_THLAR|nr:unnamed protein product [Thlaspi arvense]
MKKLKTAMEKLQKSFLLAKRQISDDFEEGGESMGVPEDVKEGHFAVVAIEDDQIKRFVVPLSCLTHPSFMRLLERAAEEYGFHQEGALIVPCRPSELERIVAEHWIKGC